MSSVIPSPRSDTFSTQNRMLMRRNVNSDFSEISEVSPKGLFRVTPCLGFKTSPPFHTKMTDLEENEAVGGTHFM